MILEVLDRRSTEVRHRVRLDRLPFTVGRGFGNDLILDDPYVDARHARIALDDNGGLVIEDLGSVNGLLVERAAERVRQLTVYPGAAIRIGRTVLRFRDADEPVVVALRDVPDPARTVSLASRWLATTPWQLAIIGAAVAGFSIYAWLGNFERSARGAVFAMALVYLVMAALWAGIWAIAGRVVVHRFRYLEHLAIISLAAIASLGFVLFTEWAAFLFPDNVLSSAVELAFGFGLIVALVAGHLALASAMPSHRCWRAGLVTSGILLGLAGVASLAESDEFSDVPEFSGVLKPAPGVLVPGGTIDGFAEVSADLRDEVDQLAAER